jgi:hypothetical protein
MSKYASPTAVEIGPHGSFNHIVDHSVVTCGNCGQTPVGEACYHLCFNSPHYYSAEQERYDDQFYGDDDNRERYAETLASMEHEGDDDEPMFEAVGLSVYDSITAALFNDDLPF